MSEKPKEDWFLVGLAFALGLVIGIMDVRFEWLGTTLLLVIALTGFMGFVNPKRAWLYALTVGICLPLAQLVGPMVNERLTSKDVLPSFLTSFVVLVPAFIGAYFGALMGWAISFFRKKPVKKANRVENSVATE